MVVGKILFAMFDYTLILFATFQSYSDKEYNRNFANKICQLPWSVQDVSPNIVYIIHSNMMLKEYKTFAKNFSEMLAGAAK